MHRIRIFLAVLLLNAYQPASAQKFFVDESFEGESWSYKVPHKYNTSRKSGSLVNGTLKVTIQPKTYGSSGDKKNGTERAEFAKQIIGGFNKLDRTKPFFMEFDARVEKGFQASKRTMISQIKVTDKSKNSPAAAIYLSDGGAAKCVNYNETDNKKLHTQNHTSIKLATEINILDGDWHTFKIIMQVHDERGYCKILVDDQVVLEVNNYDSKDKGASGVLGRIGIYRDALPYSQTVYFDNWKIGEFTR